MQPRRHHAGGRSLLFGSVEPVLCTLCLLCGRACFWAACLVPRLRVAKGRVCCSGAGAGAPISGCSAGAPSVGGAAMRRRHAPCAWRAPGHWPHVLMLPIPHWQYCCLCAGCTMQLTSLTCLGLRAMVWQVSAGHYPRTLNVASCIPHGTSLRLPVLIPSNFLQRSRWRRVWEPMRGRRARLGAAWQY